MNQVGPAAGALGMHRIEVSVGRVLQPAEIGREGAGFLVRGLAEPDEADGRVDAAVGEDDVGIGDRASRRCERFSTPPTLLRAAGV